ncbi:MULTISPECIES: TetR/AcrR family transcriptional regulator [unclassified Myxococcus]|jgi:AcrR family transcriptional regulator|uniref:TetR/AcrR family transcriptional regulator n=1 Tax=Myxococcus TaxID=32 RepID=UPI001CBDE937|nr:MULTISPECIES: TetR/AcrR family transcriptional regulator [unclassified Myxococcus]BDT31066.1 TetR/AcrR family transcriptional regulator [Myxococcus sp. MH1]
MTAARAEFARKGLRGARIEDITAACGLSKGAFYLHFESKEALFAEVLTSLETRLNSLNTRRMEAVERHFREQGLPGPRDRRDFIERYQRFFQTEIDFDLESLELMWSHRDIVAVLVSGSQGTPFESLLWRMTDAQVERVARDFRRMQEAGAADSEMDARLFASFIVGAYVLLAQRMVHLQQKPDLTAWAHTLQRLCEGGTVPRFEPSAVARPSVRAQRPKTSTRRAPARAKTRHTPRKRP